MERARYEKSSEGEKVISPFAQNSATLASNDRSRRKLFLCIGVGLFLVIVGILAGMYGMRFANDPYRTLVDFPVSKYLDDYKGLAGSKFRAELRVESDLGWKDGGGRLMLFSTASDPRPIAILIPMAASKDIYFTKGQNYTAEIEVKEGGLIYANSFQKN